MDTNKRFDIVYYRFYRPIYDMALEYESSALTVQNRVNSPEVVKKFRELKEALSKQLNEFYD